MDYIPLLLCIWGAVGIVCGVIGCLLGMSKDAGELGFILGFLLGPIGIIVSAFADGRTPCPHCGTKLNGRPAICPGCKTRFEWDGKECTFYPPEQKTTA